MNTTQKTLLGGRPRTLVVLMALLALLLAACGGGGSDDGTDAAGQGGDTATDGGDTGEDDGAMQEETVQVGFIAALSGGGIGWGMSMLGGLEMAFEEVNEEGGLEVGDKRYTFEVISYDSEYTGPGASQAAQRLISQDGVDVIFGPLGSAPMLAIADITERAEVLVLSNSYTSKALSPDKPFTFRLTPTTFEFSKPMLAFIGEEFPELETVAILYPNDESGEEVLSHNEGGYEEAGIEVIASEAYERGTEDFTTIINRAVESSPDILELNGTTPHDSGVIVRQARQLGFEGQIIKTGGPGTPEILRVAGDDAEGLLYYSAWDPNATEIQELTQRFEEQYDMPMDALGIYFYEGGKMFMEAIKAVGSFDHEALRDYLDEEQPSHTGLAGTFEWGGEASYGINHQWQAPFYVGQVQDGEEVMLTNIQPSD